MEAREWLHLSEIAEDRVNVKVLPNGKKAIVLRRGLELRVYGEVCPHLGADLSEATYCPREGTLQCKWHGYVFSFDDGRLESNPNEQMMRELRTPSSTFRPETTPKYRLSVIRHAVEDSRLYLLPKESAE